MARFLRWLAMANLETMSANRLQIEIDKRGAKDREYLDLLIANGYGDTTGNTLDAMVRANNAPQLVIKARESSRAYHEALDEQDRRRRYHGSEKPIKKKTIY